MVYKISLVGIPLSLDIYFETATDTYSGLPAWWFVYLFLLILWLCISKHISASLHLYWIKVECCVPSNTRNILVLSKSHIIYQYFLLAAGICFYHWVHFSIYCFVIEDSKRQMPLYPFPFFMSLNFYNDNVFFTFSCFQTKVPFLCGLRESFATYII